MSNSEAVATELPPDSLVAFVEACLAIDDATIRKCTGSPITHEVYLAGWDRFSISAEIAAKQRIVDRYRDVLAELRQREQNGSSTMTLFARIRAEEAGRAFMAIALTYWDRHGYGKAWRGQWSAEEWKL